MLSGVSDVDQEWVDLIKMARDMGMTMEEIRQFLDEHNPDKKTA